MSDNPPLPPPQDRGALVIRDNVVETVIRKVAAAESHVERASGLRRLVDDDLPRARVRRDGGGVVAAVTVAACWPTPAARLAERVRETVTARVRDQTGLTVTRIDVTVQYVPPPNQEIRRVP